MKRYTLILTLILSGLISLALMHACTHSQANSKSTELSASDIPELLARNPGLGTPEERQNTLNVYAGLRKALEQDHMDIDPRIKLIQLFMLEARVGGEHGYYYPEALKQIDILLSFSPPKEDRFYALSLKAGILLSLHKFPEALLVAQEARDLNPYNAQIFGALVDGYVDLGDYESAVEMSDKMISIRPDLRSYARVSYLREIYGDIDGAIEAMQMAVDAAYPGYEESAWCRLTLGNLYENYGRLDEAKAQYEQILKERKDYPFAIAALAGIATKKGDYKEAKKLLEEACSFIPEVSFYEQLVEVYQQLGEEEKAKETLAEVLEMLKDDTEKGHNMGLAFSRLYLHEYKDYQQALNYTLEEAKQRPKNIDVNQMLAGIYYQMGNYTQANEHITKAGVTDSQAPEYLCLKGLILRKMGKDIEGDVFIKKALESNPYLPKMWVDAAMN